MAGNKIIADNADLAPLLGTLRQLIGDARSRVLQVLDTIQVQTCWQVGRHIVEFEQRRGCAGGLRQAPAASAG